MCGILAVVSKSPLKRFFIQESLASLQRIKHRGPDGEGVLLINAETGVCASLRTKDTPANVACDYQEIAEVPENAFNILLGHRRLSIIDLSAQGHQPMVANGVSVTYNGEIYNYLELKEELKTKGYSFQTNSDTEVLINAYLEWGAACLNKFNGMWSFVLWDNKAKKLFIANDRFGVKPLYYANVEDKTVLVSEIKQYLDFSAFNKEFNEQYFKDYLELGTTYVGLKTPFEQVSRFPCGHCTNLTNLQEFKKEKFSAFYSIYNIKKQKWKEQDAFHAFRELFFDAVKIRTRTDVPYGVGLSGGLDSSSVLLGVKKMLNEKGQAEKPFTFSAVFPGNDEDESNHINEILKIVPSQNQQTNPLINFDIEEFIRHIYYQEILPVTSAYYSQYQVAKLANSNNVKVLLVGQGADEVFAGYHDHFYKYIRGLFLKGMFFRATNEVVKYQKLKKLDNSDYTKRIKSEVLMGIKSKLFNLKLPFPLNINDLESFLKVDFSHLQLPTYLNSDDRTAMASSIETRHPFMDFRLVEFGFSIPSNLKIKNGWQKWIIRKSMSELPDKIRWRKDKKGFSTPINVFQNELGPKNNFKEKKMFREMVYEKFMEVYK